MHKEWKSNLLGCEPSDNGVSREEIDESKIIGNYLKIIWMFGMIDRADKEARVYCVLDDRSHENLISYVRNNIYTVNDDLDRENSLNTRIYPIALQAINLRLLKKLDINYIGQITPYSLVLDYSIQILLKVSDPN